MARPLGDSDLASRHRNAAEKARGRPYPLGDARHEPLPSPLCAQLVLYTVDLARNVLSDLGIERLLDTSCSPMLSMNKMYGRVVASTGDAAITTFSHPHSANHLVRGTSIREL